MPDEVVLEVTDLHAQYGERTILQGVDLTVRSGEIVVVLGTSGCGKSTLLKNIIRLHRPTRGSVRLLGREVADMEEEELEAMLREIGVMYQYGALLNSMTVGENVALPLEMHSSVSPALRKAIASLKLRQVGLEGTYDLYPKELSGGMRKRAAVARALVMDPRILFCDEPSAGLDPVTAGSLDDMLLRLKSSLGMTMVVITHEIRSIRRIADRIAYLHGGRILFTGTVAEAVQSGIPEVTEFFLRGAE